MGSGLSASRRERRKRQPAALPLLERDDPYGSPRYVFASVLVFRAQNPKLGQPWSHGPNLEPPPRSAEPSAKREASPPTRGLPADRAEFQVFAGAQGGRDAAPHPPTAVLPAQRATGGPAISGGALRGGRALLTRALASHLACRLLQMLPSARKAYRSRPCSGGGLRGRPGADMACARVLCQLKSSVIA